MDERLYTEEEVAEAIRRATADPEGLRHSEVLAAAEEAGMNSEALERELSIHQTRPIKNGFSSALPFTVDPGHFPDVMSQISSMARLTTKAEGFRTNCYFEIGAQRYLVTLTSLPTSTKVEVWPIPNLHIFLTFMIGMLGMIGAFLLSQGFAFGLLMAAFSVVAMGLIFIYPLDRKERLKEAGNAIIARLHKLRSR